MPGAISYTTLKFAHRNNTGNVFAVWIEGGSGSRFENMFPLKPGSSVITCFLNGVSICAEFREKAGGRIIIITRAYFAAKQQSGRLHDGLIAESIYYIH